jgi:hypothetical protein
VFRSFRGIDSFRAHTDRAFQIFGSLTQVLLVSFSLLKKKASLPTASENKMMVTMVPLTIINSRQLKHRFAMTNAGSVWIALLSALLVFVSPTTTSAFVVPTSTFSPNQLRPLGQHHSRCSYTQCRRPRTTSIALSAASLPSLLPDILLEPLQEVSFKLDIPPAVLEFLGPYFAGDSAVLLALALATFTTLATIKSLLPRQPLVDPSTLESILAGTFLQGSLQSDNLICVYRADRDGWSAIDFHNAVDGQGSGLVVCEMSGSGKLFGGLNPSGWRSTDDYYSSSAAFLWTRLSSNEIVKFPAYSGGSAAIFDYATAGPTFGAADLMIGPPEAAIMGGFAGPDMEDMAVNAGNLKRGKSAVGGAYDPDPRWPARGNFRLSQVEVYCNDYSSSTGSSSKRRG